MPAIAPMGRSCRLTPVFPATQERTLSAMLLLLGGSYCVASARAGFLLRPLGRPTLANDGWPPHPKWAKVSPRTSGFSPRGKIPSLKRSFNEAS